MDKYFDAHYGQQTLPVVEERQELGGNESFKEWLRKAIELVEWSFETILYVVKTLFDVCKELVKSL